MAPQDFDFKIITMDDLPVYNQDFDDNGTMPDACVKFRNEISALNGLIFITREYKRPVTCFIKIPWV